MKKKQLKHIGGTSIPTLLTKANELGIKKENIVQIFESNHSYYLIYES